MVERRIEESGSVESSGPMNWDELTKVLGDSGDSHSLDSVVKLESSEAENVAQWFSFKADLDFAADAIRYLIELGDKQDDPPLPPSAPLLLVRRSLYMAAVVVYARCFAPGSRGRLMPEEMFQSEEARRTHAHAIEVRNRHLAHAASPLEEVRVGLLLVPDEAGWLGKNVIVQAAKLSQLKISDLRVFLRLLEEVAEAVESRALEAHSRLRECVAAMPREEITALPPLERESDELRMPQTRRERRLFRRLFHGAQRARLALPCHSRATSFAAGPPDGGPESAGPRFASPTRPRLDP